MDSDETPGSDVYWVYAENIINVIFRHNEGFPIETITEDYEYVDDGFNRDMEGAMKIIEKRLKQNIDDTFSEISAKPYVLEQYNLYLSTSWQNCSSRGFSADDFLHYCVSVSCLAERIYRAGSEEDFPFLAYMTVLKAFEKYYSKYGEWNTLHIAAQDIMIQERESGNLPAPEHEPPVYEQNASIANSEVDSANRNCNVSQQSIGSSSGEFCEFVTFSDSETGLSDISSTSSSHSSSPEVIQLNVVSSTSKCEETPSSTSNHQCTVHNTVDENSLHLSSGQNSHGQNSRNTSHSSSSSPQQHQNCDSKNRETALSQIDLHMERPSGLNETPKGTNGTSRGSFSPIKHSSRIHSESGTLTEEYEQFLIESCASESSENTSSETSPSRSSDFKGNCSKLLQLSNNDLEKLKSKTTSAHRLDSCKKKTYGRSRKKSGYRSRSRSEKDSDSS